MKGLVTLSHWRPYESGCKIEILVRIQDSAKIHNNTHLTVHAYLEADSNITTPLSKAQSTATTTKINR